MAPSPAPALEVRGLGLGLTSGEPIVEDVTLEVSQGEILGLVGESGSGKTTTALALLGYARPGVRLEAGEIEVAGESLAGREESSARRLRGRLVSYVPQDPGNALNPALRIGRSIQDMLDEHAGAREFGSVSSALTSVELPDDRGVRAPLPARALGRTAAAGHDRDGARLRAAARRSRRADDGPRRGHTGARPRRDRPAPPGAFPGDGLRLARPCGGLADRRPDRGDVRGQDRRGGTGRRGASEPEASVHTRPDRLDPGPRPPAAAAGHAGCGGRRRGASSRLCVRAPLPAEDAPLRG